MGTTNMVPAQQQQQSVAKKQPGFLELLQDPKMKAQIAAALPKHMTPERMIRVCLTAWRKTPALQKCDPLSVISSIVQASQLGLEPDGVLGHAYLVPYGNQCQLIPGYRGLIDLARRSGSVVSIQAHMVYERDKFEFAYGLDEKLSHTPCMDGDRGKEVAVYAVAKLKDGGYALEVMSIADVNKIRSRSKAANNGPWVTDFAEMARKTVVRRMVKYLPLSVELQTAVAIDERAEAGLDYESVIDVAPTDPDPIRATVSLDSFKASASENRGHDATQPPAEQKPEAPAPEQRPTAKDQNPEPSTQKESTPETQPGKIGGDPPSDLPHFVDWPETLDQNWYWIGDLLYCWSEETGNYQKHSSRPFHAGPQKTQQAGAFKFRRAQ